MALKWKGTIQKIMLNFDSHLKLCKLSSRFRALLGAQTFFRLFLCCPLMEDIL
jgi:hypothetical protein